MSRLATGLVFCASLLLSGCGVVQTIQNAKQQSDVKEQVQSRDQQLRAITAQCNVEYQTPELDPIRHKVEFFRASAETAPPFEILSNDTFPTESDLPVIAKWASLRDGCLKRQDTVTIVPASATPMQAAFVQHQWAFVKELNGQVGSLIVALYQQKLTYGEFGQRRYELARDTVKAEREWRETALIADQQRQVQAQQFAQQEFQDNLNAWAAYTQTVSSRQPQTIHLSTSCMSQPVGNFTMTNCH